MGIVVVKKPKKKPLKSADPRLRRAIEVAESYIKAEEEEAAKKKKSEAAKKKPKKTEFQKRREIISGAAGSGLSISARQKYLLTGDLPKKRKRDKKE